MWSYINTIVKRVWCNHLLIIMLFRGFYGIIVGVALYSIFSNDSILIQLFSAVFKHYYPYLIWLYTVLMYPISAVFVKLIIGSKKKFDIYLRGFTIYFVLVVLTYSILAAT